MTRKDIEEITKMPWAVIKDAAKDPELLLELLGVVHSHGKLEGVNIATNAQNQLLRSIA